MPKEYKKIGWIKCPVCGESLPVKEADNGAGTPWVNCGRCHWRSFFNGTEGQEIKKQLHNGQSYRSLGGIEIKPLTVAAPVPEQPKQEEETSYGVGLF